jgi:hypothetical protein
LVSILAPAECGAVFVRYLWPPPAEEPRAPPIEALLDEPPPVEPPVLRAPVELGELLELPVFDARRGLGLDDNEAGDWRDPLKAVGPVAVLVYRGAPVA